MAQLGTQARRVLVRSMVNAQRGRTSAAWLSCAQSGWPYLCVRGKSTHVALDEEYDQYTWPRGSQGLAAGYTPPVTSLAVAELVRAFRVYGHEVAQLDPLAMTPMPPQFQRSFGALFDSMDGNQGQSHGPVNLKGFEGMGVLDQSATYNLGGEFSFRRQWTIPDLVAFLRATYTGSVGFEYSHVRNAADKRWLRSKIEQPGSLAPPTVARRRALGHLTSVDYFEAALAESFPSFKRFGVDGCESLVPLLRRLMTTAADLGVRHVEMGMAHRGRLAVLAHVMKKPYGRIFHEFGSRRTDMEVGDVKYHLGASTTVDIESERLHSPPHRLSVCLAANPSHLEVVDPVVMGSTRAMQHKAGPGSDETILGVLVHGDASFSGQGIVAETLQLSDLVAYSVGGMIHVVVNNQIGFTASPHRSRSSPHPTDFAKALGIPVLHVNADDTDAVISVAALAAAWRQKTGKSIVIDLVGYRRNGHNEQDNPMYTQPMMYAKIATMTPVRDKYKQQLLQERVMTGQQVQEVEAEIVDTLDDHKRNANKYAVTWMDWLATSWQADALGRAPVGQLATGVDIGDLRKIGEIVYSIPDGFTPHPDVAKIMKERGKMVERGKHINWGCAEALAFASLLSDGHHVRLTGQDSERGTFSHRHAVLHDQTNGTEHVALQLVNPRSVRDLEPTDGRAEHYQRLFRVYNSSLSEAAVLAFEYGYSLRYPRALVMWEAQFGDFANVCASVVDSYIATGEHRWGLKSGLVMLLPHGFEGQGPDHSSARPERYLQLCNGDPEDIPGMSSADISAIDTGFDAVDEDGNGELDFTEVMTALTSIASQATHAEPGVESRLSKADHEAWAHAVFRDIDKDGNGFIDRSEWHGFMRVWLREHAQRHNNLLVVIPSTPAQYFHCLRRQLLSEYQKPLVLVTPKSIMHHRPCKSGIEEFGPGTGFQPVLGHEHGKHDVDPQDVRRVLMCTGQVYFALRRTRAASKAWDVAIVRVEELSPFPFDHLATATFRAFPNAELVWVQEEPQNMGYWTYVEKRIQTMVRVLAGDADAVSRHNSVKGTTTREVGGVTSPAVRYVGRPVAACATGSFHVHTAETRDHVLRPAFE